jgi:hypothetical protein
VSVKTSEYINPAFQAILATPQVAPSHNSVVTIGKDLVVPSYVGKSTKQSGIDLVHPLLNALVKLWFELDDWQSETAIGDLADGCDEDKGRIDFTRKLENGKYIAIEVQFGNSSYIARDLEKLSMLHRQGLLEMGYYVVMTRETANTSDTGQATFEAAVRRVKTHLRDLPVCVVGLSREDSEVADLRQVRDIVYPPVLGGSGTGTEALHMFLAEALLDRKDLATLKLPAKLRAVIHEHAREHTRKTVQAFQMERDRALACQDPQLRDELLAIMAETIRHSLPAADTAPRRKPVRRTTAAPTDALEAQALATTTVSAVPIMEAECTDTPTHGGYPFEGKVVRRVAKGTEATKKVSQPVLRVAERPKPAPNTALGHKLAAALGRG